MARAKISIIFFKKVPHYADLRIFLKKKKKNMCCFITTSKESKEDSEQLLYKPLVYRERHTFEDPNYSKTKCMFSL